MNLIITIYARVLEDYPNLIKCTENLYYVLFDERDKDNRKAFEVLEKRNKRKTEVLTIADKAISRLVESPYPEGRRISALLLSRYADIGWMGRHFKE